MAVQVSKSDLIEFIVEILRMGAGWVVVSSLSDALFQRFSMLRLRAGQRSGFNVRLW